MFSWVHVGEVAVLMAIAYGMGCGMGVLAYRLAHRPARPVIASVRPEELAARTAEKLPSGEMQNTAPETPEMVPETAVLLADSAAFVPVKIPAPARGEDHHVPPSRKLALAKPRPGVSADTAIAPVIGPPDAGVPVVAAPRPGRPRTLAKPRGGVRDDLKAIKGIGPRLESRLNEMGVFHLAQIAAWSRANGEWVSHELGFPNRIAREDWIGQAKALKPRERKA